MIRPMSSPSIRFSAPPASREELLARGRAARDRTGWSDLARLTTSGRRPLAILAEQNRTRLPELVPLRSERMSVSPFTFYRGTAALMAADLARDPSSGILVGSCGDAHVSNFGFYASQQRSLVFDLNDFDEAAFAPWEWDVKRLVASIVVAGQATDRKQSVVQKAGRKAIKSYLRTLSAAVDVSPSDRYFAHFVAEASLRGLDKRSRDVLAAAIKDASKRTGKRAARRLTEVDGDGRPRFVERPPTTTHIDDGTVAVLAEALRQYDESVNVDIRLLLRHYHLADVVLRVVGVGSVGTRCYLALFHAGDDSSLVLQVKEAGQSVLEQYGGVAQPPELQDMVAADGEGARVVGMQRILQGVSDPFLGSIRSRTRGYYVRQFHDMKGGIDMESLDDEPFREYAGACGTLLARAHAQSPAAVEIVGYAGDGKELADALLSWCADYAHLSRADYHEFVGSGEPTPA